MSETYPLPDFMEFVILLTASAPADLQTHQSNLSHYWIAMYRTLSRYLLVYLVTFCAFLCRFYCIYCVVIYIVIFQRFHFTIPRFLSGDL